MKAIKPPQSNQLKRRLNARHLRACQGLLLDKSADTKLYVKIAQAPDIPYFFYLFWYNKNDV
jgi:hypothetical protein